jgi:hypothetical protein
LDASAGARRLFANEKVAAAYDEPTQVDIVRTMTARHSEIDQATKWLQRMRGRLGWLIEDGFAETKTRVLPAQFQLRFEGTHAAISISVVPGKSEIEIFLKRRQTPGHGPAL